MLILSPRPCLLKTAMLMTFVVTPSVTSTGRTPILMTFSTVLAVLKLMLSSDRPCAVLPEKEELLKPVLTSSLGSKGVQR